MAHEPRASERAGGRRCAISCLIVLALLTAPFLVFGGIGSDIPFDGAAWRGIDDGTAGGMGFSIGPSLLRPDPTRARMINDLLTNHLKLGMTRKQVEAMKLGCRGAGGNDERWVSSVDLFYAMTKRQKLESYLRWGTTYPYLVTRFENNILVDAHVGELEM